MIRLADCGDVSTRLEEGWTAWADGDVETAHGIAVDLDDCESTSDSKHLLAFTTFVRGGHEEAIGLMEGVVGERTDDMHTVVVDAYLHLDRPADALAYAEQRGLAEEFTEPSRQRVEQPLTVALDTLSEIPFDTDAYLAEYIPALDATINGHPVTARLDTGGEFIATSVATADELGVVTSWCTDGYQGSNPTQICLGTADSLLVGDAVLSHVPVVTLDSLDFDDPILGTNVLQRFLSTIDYPNDRLILSPRGDEDLAAEHAAMLPQGSTEVPFYMWADHFLFAAGGYGDIAGLTWFVDSGLVVVGPNGQAALRADTESLLEWGVLESADDTTELIATDADILLGPLAQSGHIITHDMSEHGNWSFGGVETDGLLGHAFMNAYAWTLDFDEGTFRFSE